MQTETLKTTGSGGAGGGGDSKYKGSSVARRLGAFGLDKEQSGACVIIRKAVCVRPRFKK